MSENMDENLDIITLSGPTGETLDFYIVAGIAHEDKYYLILQPTVKLEELEEDEAIVFEVIEEGEGDENSRFDVVLDQEIIDAVFKKYNELLDEEMKKNK